MSAELLLREFDRLSEAPDAIPRLRQFVLDLAVRGALLSDPKRNAWRSVPIADLAYIEMGQSPPSEHYNQHGDGLPFYQGKADFGPRHPTPRNWCTQPTKKAREGDILISVRAPVGPTNVASEDCCIGRGLAALRPRPEVVLDFILLSLRAFEQHLAALGFGTTFVAINKGHLSTFLLPFPSISDQNETVAKVSELMALCDRLEAAQAERERRRDRVASITVQRLHQSSDRIGHGDVQFYLRHMPRLTSRRGHTEELRESILRMAVTGVLMPQRAEDASARETLTTADAVRAEIAKQDRRADAEQQELFLPDERWAIPPSWEWRGLADLALFIDYRGQTPTKSQSGVKLITAKNVRKGVINSLPEEFVSEEQYTKWMTRGLPKPGDVLFTTEAPMGNAAVVDLIDAFALAQRVICFRGYGATDPAFLVLQLLSPPFQAILDKAGTGLTAKGIKAAKLKRLPFAVPPLAEQQRIVGKVNEFTAACEQLESRLEVIQSQRKRLLDSTLHRGLAAG